MARVVVLGGTGFVGTNLCQQFAESGVSFRSISRREGIDIRNEPLFIKTLSEEKPEFIIHCAAIVGSLNYVTQHADSVICENAAIAISLYRSVLKACPKAIVINPLANCIYPNLEQEALKEENLFSGPPHSSVFAYGCSRRFLWAISECFRAQHGIRSVHFLVPNMYGPHDSTDPNKAHALNALVSKVIKIKKEGGGELVVWGSGVAIREWLFACDFARFLLAYFPSPHSFDVTQPLNVGQNWGLSVSDLVKIIVKESEFKGAITFDRKMPDGVPKKVLDDRKFRKAFPDFRFTRLETGIRQTVRYYDSLDYTSELRKSA